jgi:hypothetical protein
VVDPFGDLAGILCVADGQKNAEMAAAKARRMSRNPQKSVIQSQVTMAGAAAHGHDLSRHRKKVTAGGASQVMMVGPAGLEPATRPL